MGKKQHFAIVPDSLIAKRDPKRLQLYCELYMLEVSNQQYNLRHFCKDKKVSYNIAYALLRIVRDTLGNSRTKKTSNKQTKNNNKKDTKNILDNADKIDTQRQELTKSQQNNDKKQQSNNNDNASFARPAGIPKGLQLESELKLELDSNERSNDLLSFSQIMQLPEEDRLRYVAENRAKLQEAKII